MGLPIAPERAGRIVALEGPSALVSSQLRLLPASQHILVLPSLQHYLDTPDSDAPFNARELIRRYHTAALARHAEAEDFLRHSTAAKRKRLVFLQGGTMAAQIACLSPIMEHETDGDIEEAYATFIRFASNEVTGLPSARFSCFQTGSTPSESSAECEDPAEGAWNEGQPQQDVWARYLDPEDDAIEDPIIRAMRAADALDKETEFLQPLTPDMGLSVKLVDIPSRSNRRLSSTAAESSERRRGSRPPSPRGLQSQNTEFVPRVSPPADATAASAAATPRKPPLRLRIPSQPSGRVNEVAVVAGSQPSTELAQPDIPVPPRSRHRRSQTAESCLSPTEKPDGDGIAGTGMSDGVAPGDPLVTEQNDDPIPADLVKTAPERTAEEPFNAVLPLLEDFVVFFTPQTPDDLHEFVFQRLSDACATPRQSIPEPDPSGEHYATQSTGTSHIETEEAYDTARNGEVSSQVAQWARDDLVHGLPTPNHSPAPLDRAASVTSLPAPRLYSIHVGPETAVSIQNFLRSFLGSRFPLRDRRFSDTRDFPEEGGLWKPLECDGHVVSPIGESRLDLVLAVGAETGVKKSRLSEVLGQIEKLGFKTSGLSRSGRLDIRYLIANAMQAFTAQPLTKQTQSNPFADRTLLAALIIPHLETYLATHTDVRFLLIEYPAEHLPTILALQALIGTEMMKVVGIINSDVTSPLQSLPDPNAPRRPSEGFRSLNRRGSRQSSGAFVGPCSFSKANFLLASSATGFETAAFVAAIRESLISISDFYIPDRPLYKPPPAPHSPPRPTYPSLTIPTRAASLRSVSQASSTQKTPTHVSASTLVITPPSSPTHEHHASPLTRPQQQHQPTIAALSAPSNPPNPQDNNSGSDRPSARRPSIRWGEVNYAPSPPSVAASSIASTSTSNLSSSASSSRLYHQHHHHDHHQTNHLNDSHHHHHHHHQHHQHIPPCRRARSHPAIGSASRAVGSAPFSPPLPRGYREGGEGRGADDGDDDGGEGEEGEEVVVVLRDGEIGEEVEEEDEDDDDVPDEEERRLMPLFLRRRSEIERGRSAKAFKFLGLV